MWKVQKVTEFTIDEIDVTAVTDSCIVLTNNKKVYRKQVTRNRYFETREKALEYIHDWYKTEIQKNQKIIDGLNFDYSELIRKRVITKR